MNSNDKIKYFKKILQYICKQMKLLYMEKF